MTFKATYQSYRATGFFSGLVSDYVEGIDKLKEFYLHTPDENGVQDAIKHRNFPEEDRRALYEQWLAQYEGVNSHQNVTDNIRSILDKNTFTICSAHQPNIFTGPSYFIYKIIHAISMATELNNKWKDFHFVPVYFMGSEDADLEELGIVNLAGEKYVWGTSQKGAVGRMLVDDAFISLIEKVKSGLSHLPRGASICESINRAYSPGKSIRQATFELVHDLFQEFGLLVFVPDSHATKKRCIPLFRKELTEGFSHQSLNDTVQKFPVEYKLQTPGREINLFYLEDGVRERIVKQANGFEVVNTTMKFTKEQMLDCLQEKPESFSPNVVLRPLMQELLLPNVVFIGGGSEIAYWLELGEVFKVAAIPFPVLVLRNSYLIIDAATTKAIQNNKLQPSDFFLPEHELASLYLQKNGIDLQILSGEMQALASLYAQIKVKATEADTTLADHVEALLKNSMDKIQALEKKMIRAEKRKNETALKRIAGIKNNIFPEESLQERREGGLLFLSKYGETFIKEVLRHSQSFNQQFCILTEE